MNAFDGALPKQNHAMLSFLALNSRKAILRTKALTACLLLQCLVAKLPMPRHVMHTCSPAEPTQ